MTEGEHTLVVDEAKTSLFASAVGSFSKVADGCCSTRHIPWFNSALPKWTNQNAQFISRASRGGDFSSKTSPVIIRIFFLRLFPYPAYDVAMNGADEHQPA